MTDLKYAPVTLLDVVELANFMRRADRDELTARHPHMEIISLLIDCSLRTECYSVRDASGLLVCIGGLGMDFTHGHGVPWMLCTDLCERHKIGLLRLAHQALAEWGKDISVFLNEMDRNNQLHVRWVKALGFHLIDNPGSRWIVFWKRNNSSV